jgi:dipeptidyl aminopeptidase/acylaminoacyl peptidase
MIQMTLPGELRFQGELIGKDDIGIFSPDKKLFLILLERGNLEHNTNDYWIECFQTRYAMSGGSVTKLVQFSSSSNRPAISQVRWLNDGTISFLAENPKQVSQLYTLEVKTKRLTQLTHSRESLTTYAIAPGLRHIAFATEMPYRSLDSTQTAGRDIVVREQPLLDLLLGHSTFEHGAFSDLFVQDGPSGIPSKIVLDGSMYNFGAPSLSPDGRYLIVKSVLSRKPSPQWYGYRDPVLESQLAQDTEDGRKRFVFQFQIVDMNSRTSRPLLDSPIPPGDYPDVLWSPDSRSVLLSPTLLPLNDSNHESLRQNSKFLAELDIATGMITPITADEVRLRSWDATGHVTGLTGSWSGAGSLFDGLPIEYQKKNGLWSKVPADEIRAGETNRLNLTLVEDMNTPPKIYVQDSENGTQKLLKDLNPQFANLEFGEVRDLGTLTDNGLSIKAGIYLPVGYKPGVRYPLVIQTHEWTPERFWIDGPFHSASAAQALAGKGFIVAQVALNRSHRSTLQEVQEEAAGYDTVISYLNKQGMVDTNKLGIIGFSRTALGVGYALTHSKYHFAAATLADGSDAGYFRYIAYLNSSPSATRDSEGINGGAPVGGGMQSWLRTSPDFNLAQVSTPVRLEAYEPDTLLFTWENFAMLTRLNKPVDFIYLPDGNHALLRTSDRLVSQEGNVDWFTYWLKGEEDEAPSKKKQFARWNALRRGQSAGDTTSTAPTGNTLESRPHD